MMRRILATTLALGLVAMTPAWAQNDEPSDGDRLKSLIEEVSREVDRAEKERLADPWWIRDMRAVLSRYNNPWPDLLFSDDFSGQGPGPDAPWQVTAGEMLIDWRYGLRSVIEPRAPASGREKNENNEAVAQLFGQILQQTLQGQEGGNNQVEAAKPADFAAAKLPLPIGRAFAVLIDLTARPTRQPGAARWEIGPYVGKGARFGYRLVYNGGQGGGPGVLELLQLSSKGTRSLFRSAQPVTLEDNKVHQIVWTKDRGGHMSVSLDGQSLMELDLQGFKKGFRGFALVNAAGDIALRQITINGTKTQ